MNWGTNSVIEFKKKKKKGKNNINKFKKHE